MVVTLFVIIGYTGGRRADDLQWSQWWQNCHHDDICVINENLPAVQLVLA